MQELTHLAVSHRILKEEEGEKSEKSSSWEQAGNYGPIRYQTSEWTTYPKRDAP